MTTEQIKQQINEWKQIQYRASQMRNSKQVFKAQKELEKLYKLQDKK